MFSPSCSWQKGDLWKSNNSSPTSTYTKYGQRYWRQPVNTKPKNTETSTNVEATLFTTNKEGTNVMWLVITLEALCTAGLLRSEYMHSCIKFSNLTNYPAKSSWKSSMEIQLQKHRPVVFQTVQLIQSCKVSQKSIKKIQIQWNRRNLQTMPEICHPCISTSQVSCKPCSHHHHDIGKLQFTDISPEFHTPFWAVAVRCQINVNHQGNTMQKYCLIIVEFTCLHWPNAKNYIICTCPTQSHHSAQTYMPPFIMHPFEEIHSATNSSWALYHAKQIPSISTSIIPSK